MARPGKSYRLRKSNNNCSFDKSRWLQDLQPFFTPTAHKRNIQAASHACRFDFEDHKTPWNKSKEYATAKVSLHTEQ